jgi:hypothetical protein
VEGYGRDDSPEFCARRLEELIIENQHASHMVVPIPEKKIPEDFYSFTTVTGRLALDHAKCADCQTRGCIEACAPQILKLEENKPVLAIEREDAKKGKCTECLACEIYCKFHERNAIMIDLPIPGLKEYRDHLMLSKPE